MSLNELIEQHVGRARDNVCLSEWPIARDYNAEIKKAGQEMKDSLCAVSTVAGPNFCGAGLF